MSGALTALAIILNVGPTVEMRVNEPETYWLRMARPAAVQQGHVDVVYDPSRLDVVRVDVPEDSPCRAAMLDDDNGTATIELTCDAATYESQQQVGFVILPRAAGLTFLRVPTCQMDGECSGVGRVIEVLP